MTQDNKNPPVTDENTVTADTATDTAEEIIIPNFAPNPHPVCTRGDRWLTALMLTGSVWFCHTVNPPQGNQDAGRSFGTNMPAIVIQDNPGSRIQKASMTFSDALNDWRNRNKSQNPNPKP